tara:strand:- start:175 stop:1263 length:1089 start_codon:yes stop_codon:yes gene_type:complete
MRTKISKPKIDGVIYHPEKIERWDSLDNDRSETNYGRQTSCDINDAKKFAEKLQEDGIDYDSHPPVFYDIETRERLNGEMRYLASGMIDQQDWNMCPVEFETLRSRIKFCTKSNNKKNPIDRDNNIEDIEAAVRDLMDVDRLEGISIDETWIEREVDDMSEGSGDISPTVKNRLIAKLITELHATHGIKKSKGGERYLKWDRSVSDRLTDLYKKGKKNKKTIDPWYNEVFADKNKVTICLEHYTFNSLYYKLIKSLKKASHDTGEYNKQRPVNLAFSVKPPTSKKKDLNEIRESMFTWNLFNLETEYLSVRPMIVENGRPVEMERRHFPWNHPDARHVFIPQDKVNETDSYSLIRVKNRGFN